jgi:hypothetical protein
MADLFKEIVPAILQTKKKVLTDEKDYNAYIVNRALSFHYDCILYANFTNTNPHLDPKLQFDFLINSVRSYKRPFQKWLKKETIDNIELVKEYFNYSETKARYALTILSDADLEEIRISIDKGGTNNVRSNAIDRGKVKRA